MVAEWESKRGHAAIDDASDSHEFHHLIRPRVHLTKGPMTCKSGPLPRTRAELELYSRLALQKEIRLVPGRRRSIHNFVSSRPSPDRHHPLTETALTRHGMRVNEPVADPDEKIVQYRCEDTRSWGDFKRLSLIVTFYRAA